MSVYFVLQLLIQVYFSSIFLGKIFEYDSFFNKFVSKSQFKTNYID